MHKLKTKDQNENGAKFGGWWLSLVEVKSHEELEGNTSAIKSN
jgi:hypothetical protein